MYKVGIITASDRGAIGQREDKSGPLIERMMTEASYVITETRITTDEIGLLEAAITDLADNVKCDLILTTGGTGFSPRDVTPEATLSVIDRQAPGISEDMRYISMQKTPKAMLSRGVSGIRGQCLIINLPGSPKAVEECLSFILEPLAHGLDILNGNAGECARSSTE